MGRPFPYPNDRRLSGEQERRFRMNLVAAANWMSDEQVLVMAEALHETLRERGASSCGRRLDLRA